jgi:hypothetical protein
MQAKTRSCQKSTAVPEASGPYTSLRQRRPGPPLRVLRPDQPRRRVPAADIGIHQRVARSGRPGQHFRFLDYGTLALTVETVARLTTHRDRPPGGKEAGRLAATET